MHSRNRNLPDTQKARSLRASLSTMAVSVDTTSLSPKDNLVVLVDNTNLNPKDSLVVLEDNIKANLKVKADSVVFSRSTKAKVNGSKDQATTKVSRQQKRKRCSKQNSSRSKTERRQLKNFRCQARQTRLLNAIPIATPSIKLGPQFAITTSISNELWARGKSSSASTVAIAIFWILKKLAVSEPVSVPWRFRWATPVSVPRTIWWFWWTTPISIPRTVWRFLRTTPESISRTVWNEWRSVPSTETSSSEQRRKTNAVSSPKKLKRIWISRSTPITRTVRSWGSPSAVAIPGAGHVDEKKIRRSDERERRERAE